MDPRNSPGFTSPFGSREELIWSELHALRWSRDAGVWHLEYFTNKYREVYRYDGENLPSRERDWRRHRYEPPVEREIMIVSMAGAGRHFYDIARAVARPTLEVGAILNQHGYREY